MFMLWKKIEEYNSEWHEKCLKKFFGSKVVTVPKLDFNEEEINKLFSLKSSNNSIVTGVQKKISLHLSLNNGNTRFTIIDYPAGYILKPQSSEFKSLPENEWLTMHLAGFVLLEMTVPFSLIRLEDNTLAFITKRIDRDDERKIPMEDFCQLGGVQTIDKYRSSYENVGKIVKKYSDFIGKDLYMTFNRIFFSFIVGNSDMHLKNFSIYKIKNRYQLTPAYDLLNTLLVTDDNEQVALTLNGKKNKIELEDFKQLAKSYDLNEKQFDKLIKTYEIAYPKMIEFITNSFLSDDLKEKYIDLLNSRYDSLKISRL